VPDWIEIYIDRVSLSSGKRILVVDDDAAVTSLLRRGLTYEGYEVRTASSGREALDIAREAPPNLVILDIMMPGMDGIEVCRLLRAADQGLPIILLTAKDAPSDQVHGLETGADDYVTKPFTFEVLLARVRAHLRRENRANPPVLSYDDLLLDTGGRIGTRSGRTIQLTTTEYELLHLLMLHPGQVLTKSRIMEQVWGYDFGGNENIVEVYIRGLRKKLEMEGETRLIQTIRGAGYALRRE
jgi:two-component system response regulator MprA